MQNIMGIINLNENENKIKDLTKHRPIGAIPIAGRYRVIDFTLSNMVNMGINNVALFNHGKSRSIVDHLGTGKEWDLDRKRDGLFIFNPYINLKDNTFLYGDIKNFHDQLDYINRSKEEYVILSKSKMICNINYSDAFKFHKESGSDITIIFKKVLGDSDKFIGCDTLILDNNYKVLSIGNNIGRKINQNISMEMCILKRTLLLEIIEECITEGETILLKEAINKQIYKRNVNAYAFQGYLGCINSIENYYRINMELLDMERSKELFYKNGYIYTKNKDEPSTKYKENAKVTNSMVANGCVIDGTIKGSVIARGVEIGKGAIIKDCVIMQKCIIEEGAVLRHVILDKNVVISKEKMLCGDKKKPLVIMKNEII